MLQQAVKSAAESVSASEEIPGSSSAKRAVVATNLRTIFRNLELPLSAIILAKHDSMQYAVTGGVQMFRRTVTRRGGWLSCCPVLTHGTSPTKMLGMAHSFLVFDFGSNEDAAQQARHRIDGWKQGFRLDKKLQVKFERKEQEGKPVEVMATQTKVAKSSAKGRSNPGGKSKPGDAPSSTAHPATAEPGQIRLIVRLDFSDHEKLSHQRWIERIPLEEPFKGASPQIIRAGDPAFQTTSDLFDSLD